MTWPATQTEFETRGMGIMLAIIGLVVVVLAVRGIFTGTAQFAYHHSMQKYRRKKEPIGFWVVTLLELSGGIFFIVLGLR